MNRKLYLAVVVVVLSISLISAAPAALVQTVQTTSTDEPAVVSADIPVVTPVAHYYYSPSPYGYPFIVSGGIDPYRDAQLLGFNDRGDAALIWEPRKKRVRWIPLVPTRPGLTRAPMIIYGPGRRSETQTTARATTTAIVGEVVGTSPGSAPSVTVRTAGRVGSYALSDDSMILRGPVGGSAVETSLGAIQEGDRATIALGSDGRATSIKAQYRLVTGKVYSIDGDTITLSNGEVLRVTSTTKIVTQGNYTGTFDDIRAGGTVAARVGPVSGRAYTIRIAAMETTADTAGDSQLSLNSAGPFSAGDSVVVTYHAAPGGTATYTIPGVVENLLMAESPTGVYTGRYVVKEGDTAIRQRIVVTFKDPSGAVIRQASRPTVTIRSASSSLPRITSPRQGQVISSPIEIQGIAPPDSVVRVTVEFRRFAQSVLPIEGVTAVQDVVADSEGVWRTPPMAASSPLTDTEPPLPFDADIFSNLFNDRVEPPIVYTITAAAMGPDGEATASYSIDVTRFTGRALEGSLKPSVE